MKKNLSRILAGTFAGALALTSAGVLVPAEVKADETNVAYVSFADNNWAVQYWNDGNAYDGVTANTAQVDDYGTYTVSAELSDGFDDGFAFLDVEIANGEANFPNSYMNIDSVKINGEEVALTSATYTSSDDDIATRTNLYNAWVESVDKGRTADGASDGVTAVPVDVSAYEGVTVTSIEVTFTLSEGVAFGGDDTTEAAGVDLDGTYNAYIGIQGPKYSFRDAWNNESTGLTWEFFNQLTKQGDTATGEACPATINDAVISGNGTYTVSMTDIEWPEDEFSDQDHLNLLFVSTDIPNDGSVTVSDVALTIDGSSVDCSNYLIDPDETGYIVIAIQNIWAADKGIDSIGYYNVPFSNVEITFTVSGFNYDNEAAAAPAETAAEDTEATEAAEAEESEGGVSPVVIVIIVVVVVAVIVVIAVAASKKGKKKED